MSAQALATGVADRASVARGVWWVGLGHVIGQVAWYVSLFVIVARVAPQAYGSVTFAIVLVTVAFLLVGSGTRGSFVATRGPVSGAQVRYATAITAGSGLLVGGLLVLVAGPVAHALAPGSNVAVIRVMALSIVALGLSVVPMALLQKELLFKRHALVNSAAAVTASVVSVAAVLLGAGVWALVLRQVLFQLLIAMLAWPAARAVLPAWRGTEPRRERQRRSPQAKWFFALSVAMFVALNADYVIVGHSTSVAELGVYALAFTIAFAPTTQFAWQIGKVLFPAAAKTEGLESIAGRTLKAVRLTALVLFPLLPAMIILTPVAAKALGPQWQAIVGPLQILLAVGIVHAVFAIFREFLLGTGWVRLCVAIDTAWVIGTVAALAILVPLDGIEGAAFAHLIMLAPLAIAYLVLGLPRLGLGWRRLERALRDIVSAVGAEAAVLAVIVAALASLHLSELLVAVVASALGIAAAAAVLWRTSSGSIAEARAIVAALRS